MVALQPLERAVPNTHQDKFSRYRQRMKASGMRQMHIWVPDVNRPGFAAEVRRQVALLRGAPEERDALDFIEKTSDWPE